MVWDTSGPMMTKGFRKGQHWRTAREAEGPACASRAVAADHRLAAPGVTLSPTVAGPLLTLADSDD